MTLGLAQQVFGFSIATLLGSTVTYAYYIMLAFVIAWIIFGWVGYPSSDFFQRVYDAVNNVINPIIAPIRSRIPPLRLGGIGLDLSPIILLLGLWMGRRLLGTVIEIFIRPVTG